MYDSPVAGEEGRKYVWTRKSASFGRVRRWTHSDNSNTIERWEIQGQCHPVAIVSGVPSWLVGHRSCSNGPDLLGSQVTLVQVPAPIVIHFTMHGCMVAVGRGRNPVQSVSSRWAGFMLEVYTRTRVGERHGQTRPFQNAGLTNLTTACAQLCGTTSLRTHSEVRSSGHKEGRKTHLFKLANVAICAVVGKSN